MPGRLILFAAAIAAISFLYLAGVGAAAMSSTQKLHKSESVVAWYEGEGSWTLRPRYEKCWHLLWRSAEDRCFRHRQGYRFHRGRVERLTPAPPPVAHLAGWLCIHAREGGWHQGSHYKENGVSVYWGGLQMTVGWMGLIPGRASDLSPAQQIAAAETGYRLSGYSSAWMSGQWPRTYPPCAHLF